MIKEKIEKLLSEWQEKPKQLCSCGKTDFNNHPEWNVCPHCRDHNPSKVAKNNPVAAIKESKKYPNK